MSFSGDEGFAYGLIKADMTPHTRISELKMFK